MIAVLVLLLAATLAPAIRHLSRLWPHCPLHLPSWAAARDAEPLPRVVGGHRREIEVRSR